MRYLKALLISVAFLLCAIPASAETYTSAYVGGGGIWYDDDTSPSSMEAGGGIKLALSRYLSAVGAANYGFKDSYLRGTLGGRFGVTEQNRNALSLGVGLDYQASNEPEIRVQEWGANAYLGFKPAPDSWPRFTVALDGRYGLESHQASLAAGLRYRLNFSGGGYE